MFVYYVMYISHSDLADITCMQNSSEFRKEYYRYFLRRRDGSAMYKNAKRNLYVINII